MDENTSLVERIGRAEASIQALQRAVLDLSGKVDALSTATQQAAVLERPLEQIFCPRCHGGNPPSAKYCRWCYLPMQPEAAVGQAPASMASPPQAAAGEAAAQVEPVFTNPYTGLTEPAAHPTTPLASRVRHVARPAEAQPRPAFDFLKTSEFWLNKVGIGLLLLGVAFLFKYSIDRGWLTPEVRIAIGLAVGTILLAFGLRMQKTRPHFSQVLEGGAVGAYYITGFAAYQLFSPPLVPYEVAFGFMIAVTVLAFVLALHADNAVLSLIGTVGGLATPFVLYQGETNVPGLMAYASLLLTGAVLVYFYKGWRSLLWTSFAGGLVVFAQGLDASVAAEPSVTSVKTAIQAAVGIFVILFWGVPVLREVLAARDPERWPSPTTEWAAADVRSLLDVSAHILTVLLPFVAFGFSMSLWFSDLTRQQWGMIALAYAALYAGIAWLIRRDTSHLAYIHAMMAILLGSASLTGLLEGNTLFLAGAAEVVVLQFAARRLKDAGPAVFGHIIFSIVAIVLAVDLGRDFVLTHSALVALTVIVLIALASFAGARGSMTSLVYRLTVSGAFMGWLWLVLHEFAYGTGYVLAAWTAYALALMLLPVRLPRYFTRPETAEPAHAIMLGGAGLFAYRILEGQAGSLVLLNFDTLLDAAFLAAILAASILNPLRRFGVSIYLVAVHLGILALLARELGALPSGNAYISIAWGVYGIALFVAGISGLVHTHRMELTVGGISTLLLVVAKLFLVDLASLDPVWRILLFMGFGAAFLALSYFFQNSIRKGFEQLENPPARPGEPTVPHHGAA